MLHAIRKLFDDQTQPKYHFTPIAPFKYNYDEYIHQCALNNKAELKDYFKRCFKGKVVEWNGIVVRTEKKCTYIQCTPTDTEINNYDVKLHLTKEAQKHYDILFQENQVVKFRGELEDYGISTAHELRYLNDETIPATPGLTWEYYLSIFGRKGHEAQALYHATFWKGKQIELRGHFRDVIQLSLSASRNGSAELKLAGGFTECRQEPLAVFFPSAIPEMIKLAKQSKPTDEFRIMAEVDERTERTHTFFVRAMIGPLSSATPTRLGFQGTFFPEETPQPAPAQPVQILPPPQYSPQYQPTDQKVGYVPGQPQYSPQPITMGPQPYPPQHPQAYPQPQGYPQPGYQPSHQQYQPQQSQMAQSQYNPADPTFAPPPAAPFTVPHSHPSAGVPQKDEDIPPSLPGQGYQQQPPQSSYQPVSSEAYQQYPSLPLQ
ncbi:hypothetical protein BLNAU_1127 [Blattamonas nauphoetae]|uniref:Uncharacterized protein n=1 Tax=Blattamonas nauphoetae TaxID=2049346 RepID=A0ABQ9YJV7_9EUKA|nr:hypothetical protein BLNAU_1127 [Blattamonas nauphoetae]